MPHRISPPRILASFRGADAGDWPGEVQALQKAGIDGLHLDVMDGRWVQPTCFEATDLPLLRQAGAELLDVHLLVEDPAGRVPAYLDAGADRLTFHYETAENPGLLLDQIQKSGAVAGMALLPATPISALEPWIERLGLVNPLGVDAPRGGPFDPATFARIAALVELRERSATNFVIQADGGVWEKTRAELVAAGADELVGGYPIFSADDYAVAIRALREGVDPA